MPLPVRFRPVGAIASGRDSPPVGTDLATVFWSARGRCRSIPASDRGQAARRPLNRRLQLRVPSRVVVGARLTRRAVGATSLARKALGRRRRSGRGLGPGPTAGRRGGSGTATPRGCQRGLPPWPPTEAATVSCWSTAGAAVQAGRRAAMNAEIGQTGLVRIAVRTVGPGQGDAEAVPVPVEQAPLPRRWRGLGRLWSRRRRVHPRGRRG
jgi:hypothetical protein